MASGLSTPVGFKNGTDGIKRRINAVIRRRDRTVSWASMPTASSAVTARAANATDTWCWRRRRPANYDSVSIAMAKLRWSGRSRLQTWW